MSGFFSLLFAFGLLAVPPVTFADNDSGLAEVARVSWKKDVVGLDKKINTLDKRIAEGLRSGVLSPDRAKDLTADVQSLRGKKRK